MKRIRKKKIIFIHPEKKYETISDIEEVFWLYSEDSIHPSLLADVLKQMTKDAHM